MSLGLLLSAIAPLQAATVPTTAIWLLVLHGVVATALVPAGLRVLPPERSR